MISTIYEFSSSSLAILGLTAYFKVANRREIIETKVHLCALTTLALCVGVFQAFWQETLGKDALDVRVGSVRALSATQTIFSTSAWYAAQGAKFALCHSGLHIMNRAWNLKIWD